MAGRGLLVEGASIDKQAHAVDAERTIWDTIEMDNAVAVALEFAERTNGDDDPANDTLVLVTADHECGGLALVGVGNERYDPRRLGRAVRDYAAVYRFTPEQQLAFFPNYRPDAQGFPTDPDPSRKLLLGWAAAPDRHENWISNRRATPPAIDAIVIDEGGTTRRAIANPARDGGGPDSDSATDPWRPRVYLGAMLEGAGATSDAGRRRCAHRSLTHPTPRPRRCWRRIDEASRLCVPGATQGTPRETPRHVRFGQGRSRLRLSVPAVGARARHRR